MDPPRRIVGLISAEADTEPVPSIGIPVLKIEILN